MRSLLLQSVGMIALASGVVFACGDASHTFIDTHASGGMGGSGADGGTGGSGTSGKGGTAGKGGTGGGAGEAGADVSGGSSGKGGGGSGNLAGEAGETGTGGSRGGRGGSGGTGVSGEGGEAGGGDVIVSPKPGRPGTTLVSGGFAMESASYKLYAITSEATLPLESSSTHYVLRGGLIATTQPGNN